MKATATPPRPTAADSHRNPLSAPADLLRDPALFTRWLDPKSGVASFVLTARAAPFQQSFYYVNSGFSGDGRHFWFYCAFPPAGSANQGRSLAAADFSEGCVHHFPETGFTDASPVVHPKTGEAYWCAGLEIWKRSPAPDARPVLVNRFPAELARNRRPWRLATHLTFSADLQALNLDVEIGDEWLVGHVPLDGGPFVLWQRLPRCHNHAQFNPVDPDLQLLAQDHSVHPVSGETEPYANRLWLIRRGEKAVPVFPDAIPVAPRLKGGNPHYTGAAAHTVADERALLGHEWWSADGRHVWYVRYGQGVARVAPVRQGMPTPELVWPHRTVSHAHADASDRYLVCDSIPPEDPSDRRVTFFDIGSRREIDLVSHLPEPPGDLRRYHVHPHPRFCLNDRLICYTTTVFGRVDVAFTPVADVLASLR